MNIGKKTNRRNLRRQDEVRRSLAHVLRRLEDEAIDVDRGRALIYGYKTLAEVIRATAWEERMEALERRLGEREGQDVPAPVPS